MYPGCNPGYFYWSEPSMCVPCPPGTYNDVAGATDCAGVCLGETWTPGPGAASASNCSVCAPGSCSDHGSCTVTGHDAIRCNCDWAYTFSDDCSVPVLGMVLLAVLLVLTVGLAVAGCWRNIRAQFREYRWNEQLHEKLLNETQTELEEMQRVWDISEAELRFRTMLAEGTFGQVWLADWQDRHVAVKVLKQALLILDQDVPEKFEREIALLRSLRHRNVIFFFGCGARADGTPFLVTEFAGRGSLHKCLESPHIPLSTRLRASFALDACRGMEFLHSRTPIRLHRQAE